MRWLRNCLLVLTCAVAVLSVGSVVPWLVPIDPTVTWRVTEVSGTHDEGSPCNSEEGPKTNPYYTGYFAGDYRAEVVHYGPFFVR